MKRYSFLFVALTSLAAGELGYIDTTHKLLSEWIYDTSNKIDLFFSRKNIPAKNSSYLNISFDTYYEDGKAFSHRANAKLRIRLPRTKKRWNLIFEDYSSNISTDKTTTSSFENAFKENSYVLGIRLDNFRSNFFDTRFGGGVHFSGIKPDLYLSAYAAKSYFADNWRITIDNNAKYFLRKHFENYTDLSIGKVFSQRDKLTFSNTFHYKQNDKHLKELVNALIYDRYISSTKGISASLSIYSSKDDTRVFKLRYYLSELTYKRYFYHNFAYYTFAPGVIFRKENSFKPKARVIFRVGFYFSKSPLSGYYKFIK